MKEIKCPVCGSQILFHRRDDCDNYVSLEQNNDGVWMAGEAFSGKSNGYTAWECEKDPSHKLGKELIDWLNKNLWDECEEELN